MTNLRIYYAHPMSWYNTPDEAEDVAVLEKYGKVINPNSDEFSQIVQRAKRANYPVMQIFADYIKDKVDVVAFRAFHDGYIGAGVAREVFEARIWGKKIWTISALPLRGLSVYPLLDAQLRILENTLTVEATKERIKKGTL